MSMREFGGLDDQGENDVIFSCPGLVQSPCRNCFFRENLPRCAEDCSALAEVQELMIKRIEEYCAKKKQKTPFIEKRRFIL